MIYRQQRLQKLSSNFKKNEMPIKKSNQNKSPIALRREKRLKRLRRIGQINETWIEDTRVFFLHLLYAAEYNIERLLYIDTNINQNAEIDYKQFFFDERKELSDVNDYKLKIADDLSDLQKIGEVTEKDINEIKEKSLVTRVDELLGERIYGWQKIGNITVEILNIFKEKNHLTVLEYREIEKLENYILHYLLVEIQNIRKTLDWISPKANA